MAEITVTRKIIMNNKNAEGVWETLYPQTIAEQVITNADQRFVSDVKIAEWDAKASKAVATTSTDGLLSAADKTIIDGLTTRFDTTLQSAKTYADDAVAALVDSAPEAMNTLRELSEAITAHEDEYQGLLTVVGNKANATDVQTTVDGLNAAIALKANAADVKPTVVSQEEPVDIPNGGMWFQELV